MAVIYYLDGVDISTYGVLVSGSSGLLGRPKPKPPITAKWETYNGEAVDLSKRYYESREIELDCFIKATSKSDFITKCNTFVSLFDQTGTRRLAVKTDTNEPLVYEVYSADALEMKKEWSDGTMVGTFTIKLKESEPLKKVIKFVATAGALQVSITVTSTKLLSIHWGDSLHTLDVSGTSQVKTHTYASPGTYYIIVAGNIDEITSLTTTGTVVWAKL